MQGQYHSWKRELNKYTNGLDRKYLANSQTFNVVEHENMKEIENLLNNWPGKVLQFRTPIEVFDEDRLKPAFIALQSWKTIT